MNVAAFYPPRATTGGRRLSLLPVAATRPGEDRRLNANYATYTAGAALTRSTHDAYRRAGPARAFSCLLICREWTRHQAGERLTSSA